MGEKDDMGYLSSISCIFNGARNVTSNTEKLKPTLYTANTQINIEEQTSTPSTLTTLKAAAFLKQHSTNNLPGYKQTITRETIPS